jgi:hypothetical protein
MKRILVLVAALALASASCSGAHSVPGSYRLGANPGTGLVVLSTRIHKVREVCRTGSSVSVGFSSGPRSHSLDIGGLFAAADLEDPPGYFFVRELPAGTYTLDYIEMDGSRSPKPLDRSFRVIEGKAVYLGEFRVTVLPSCREVTFAVTDRWLTQDRQLFASRMANIDPQVVENQTIP